MTQEYQETVARLLREKSETDRKLIAFLEGRPSTTPAAAPTAEEIKLREAELDRQAARHGIRSAEGKRIWREGRGTFDVSYNAADHGAKPESIMDV